MLKRPFGLYASMSPWRDIERVQREMNRLFDQMSFGGRARVAPSYPAINVWTNDEGAIITAELPGVNPEDIEISVVGETVKLTGSRQAEELPEGTRYHRRERGHGKFTRTFQLPFTVESDRVEAVFEKGVLHISAPRAEAEKPHKIAVKTA